ncbi:hypothetical protein [Methanoregula sp. UBA64]|uniref:hypothetical protein n=1 Tax=Methanoregula sp. UBA64 TaxID=1915554 RepID=UPI0025D10E2D|nr:hypothetical protein [Methanoregula sp. UBA64]
MSYEEIIISILGLLGISGIIGTYLTYVWEKRKERESKENELKVVRYKCIILLMYAFLNPDELDSIKKNQQNIQNIVDLKRELQTEWVNSWIFAGDSTVRSLKRFLDNPNEMTFANTVLSMRKELWNKKTTLLEAEFSIKDFTH